MYSDYHYDLARQRVLDLHARPPASVWQPPLPEPAEPAAPPARLVATCTRTTMRK